MTYESGTTDVIPIRVVRCQLLKTRRLYNVHPFRNAHFSSSTIKATMKTPEPKNSWKFIQGYVSGKNNDATYFLRKAAKALTNSCWSTSLSVTDGIWNSNIYDWTIILQLTFFESTWTHMRRVWSWFLYAHNLHILIEHLGCLVRFIGKYEALEMV